MSGCARPGMKRRRCRGHCTTGRSRLWRVAPTRKVRWQREHSDCRLARRRPYFGGCNSPSSHPVTLSVFRGSGRSQSKHRNVRCPLPPGGSAWTMIAGASRPFGFAHEVNLPPNRLAVHSKWNLAGRILTVAASQREIAAGYDLDVASSKWRDLDNGPRSLTQGGNHEPNRSSFSARTNRIDEVSA